MLNIDWIIRIRHRSYRAILPTEISEIEAAISENLSIYDGELAPEDYYEEDIWSNSFVTTSHHAEQDVHEVFRDLSTRYPEFMFQTEAIHDNHEATQTNYLNGSWDMSSGGISYEPHFNVRF